MEPKPYGYKDAKITEQENKVREAMEALTSFAREPEVTGLPPGFRQVEELVNRANTYRSEFRKLHEMRNPKKEK